MNKPSTVLEAENMIQNGLERLRDVPFNEEVSQALSFLLPKGFRLSVQLEEDGRKKRDTAAISNWNHSTGEIVLFFEPIDGGTHTPAPNTVSPSATTTSYAVEPTRDVALPVTVEQEIRECCTALSDAEKMGRQFYAIKWFRDTYLPERNYAWTASVQDRQRVLTRAIQDGLIETQTIPNPKNPAFPTTTLLLNREKTKSMIGSRFRPIALRGEPLSETIIRDRGPR